MRLFAQSLTLSLGLLLIAGATPAALMAQQTTVAGWTPELAMKVKNIGAVRVSPDSRKVVYTVSQAVMTPEKSEYVTQIWLANNDGSDPLQLTFAEKSSDNPQWSPDGKMIAFTSSRSGKSNLYVLRLIGGEAEQTTDVKTGSGELRLVADGKQIAFLMRDAQSEDEEKGAKGKDDSRWVDENIKMNRLHVINIEKDANGKREPRKLTGDYNVDGDFDWAPDGKTIAFTRTKMPKADYWTTGDLMAVRRGKRRSKNDRRHQRCRVRPKYSPDGKWLLFLVSDDPPRWAGYRRLAVVSTGGGPVKLLAETFDAQPNVIDWSADGKKIYFGETRGTVSRIYSLDVNSNAITELNKGNEVISGPSLNRSQTMMGFTLQTNDRAPEAYVSQVAAFSPVQVSRANADLPKLPLGKTEAIKWKSSDGLEIEGLLTYPVNYQAGKRVPLLLIVHGGPAGVFTQSFLAGSRGVYPTEAFAARGYAMLRVNPRGSSGYGQKFRFANIKDWGGGDYAGFDDGVDGVIRLGVADPDRLGVMGWSYGGFMTSWIVTQTKTLQGGLGRSRCHEPDEFHRDGRHPQLHPGLFWRAALGKPGDLSGPLSDVPYEGSRYSYSRSARRSGRARADFAGL